MVESTDYADTLYFNRTCGEELKSATDWEKKLFTILDIEDAFDAGKLNPSEATINKIFKLNKQFLANCKLEQRNPLNTLERNNYIITHWNDDKNI